jgi:hypothetical protein
MAEGLVGGVLGSEEGKPEVEGPGTLRQAGAKSYLDQTGRALIVIGCLASSERTHPRAAGGSGNSHGAARSAAATQCPF